MKVLIAMDSFKGNLSGLEASQAVSAGVLRACPWAEVKIVPVADGGEGTVDAFVRSLRGTTVTGTVRGPLGDPVEAAWGLLPDGGAIIELAAASGLPLVPLELRNPLLTSSFGTGEQIRAALDAGARFIVLGLGGSATNDGGMGVMEALGARFLDENGAALPSCGASLERVSRIDMTGLDPRAREAEFLIACDVQNPLCGENGAAAVYAPQKGASPEMVAQLDAGLLHFAQVIERATGRSVLDMPGGGAAGGAGAGLTALLGAKLTRGIDVLAQVVGLDAEVRDADVIFTGEGRIDHQTVQGKVISGLAARARAAEVPLIAIVGCIRGHIGPLMSMGLTAVFPTASGPCTTAQSFQHSREDLERTASQIMRVMRGTLRHQAAKRRRYRAEG